GYLITLCQFAFITLAGLHQNIKWTFSKNKKFSFIIKSRKAPMHMWFFMVILFFASSIINNLVFQFHISMPIHIIFKSSTIIVNMILSFVIFKRRYTYQQVTSIFITTLGLIITTLDTSKNQKYTEEKSINKWIIGILLLIISAVLGAFIGIYQEYIFKKYPNSWKECLFYKHLLSLPLFLFLAPQIKKQYELLNNTPKHQLGNYIPILLPTFLSNLPVRGVWIFLIMNIFTQYICISGVQKLSSMCTSVTLNLVLNVRKFISLLISVFFFKNSFSYWGWFGSR
ncbi:hypothetical protein PIROE2DRAFT_37432, partial [Piromyces sp. E2]